jgi:hypothetical protein
LGADGILLRREQQRRAGRTCQVMNTTRHRSILAAREVTRKRGKTNSRDGRVSYAALLEGRF